MKYIILILLSLPVFLITSAGANCVKCNFDGKKLPNLIFKDQNLSHASFNGAYLVYADFSGANLQGSVFDGAYAYGANFSGAQLDNSSFKNVELELANFKNATMRNVTFEGAYLVHAELSKKQVLESKFCDNFVEDAMKFTGWCKNRLANFM